MHPRALREQVDTKARPFMIIIERFWGSSELPEDWKKANLTPIFKKDKEDPGNYLQAGLTSVPGELIECFIIEAVSSTWLTKR